MNITKKTVDVKPVVDLLTTFSKAQKGFANRVACHQKLHEIVEQSVKAGMRHIIRDLMHYDNCNPEAFMGRKKQGTIDLLFLNEKKKKALIVDWKRVGSLPMDKLWRYTKGPQAPFYTQIVKDQYPGYEVGFEFRFVLPGEDEPRCVTCNFSDKDLEDYEAEFARREALMYNFNQNQIWPRNAAACHMWRDEPCAFKQECWGKNRRPASKLKKIIVTQSLISLFDQCPRKYVESLAQAEVLGEDFHDVGIPNKYALWGTMFHLAISNMYQQIIDTNS